MKKLAPRSPLDIDFRNSSREEVVEKLKAIGEPTLEPLIRWILQSLEFEKSNYAIQVAIANAQRAVDGKALRVVQAVCDCPPSQRKG